MRTSYSNEDFDAAQSLAYVLTDRDREEGLETAPKYGYSQANFDRAAKAVRDNDTYHQALKALGF